MVAICANKHKNIYTRPNIIFYIYLSSRDGKSVAEYDIRLIQKMG